MNTEYLHKYIGLDACSHLPNIDVLDCSHEMEATPEIKEAANAFFKIRCRGFGFQAAFSPINAQGPLSIADAKTISTKTNEIDLVKFARLTPHESFEGAPVRSAARLAFDYACVSRHFSNLPLPTYSGTYQRAISAMVETFIDQSHADPVTFSKDGSEMKFLVDLAFELLDEAYQDESADTQTRAA